MKPTHIIIDKEIDAALDERSEEAVIEEMVQEEVADAPVPKDSDFNLPGFEEPKPVSDGKANTSPDSNLSAKELADAMQIDSESIVHGIDTLASEGLTMLAKADNSKPYKLDKESKKVLSSELSKALKLVEVKANPWVMFFLILLFCYAPIVRKAWTDRKENEKLKLLEAENLRKQREIDQLKLDLEKAKITKKMNELNKKETTT